MKELNQSPAHIAILVKNLSQTREALKQLNLRENELKAQIRAYMGTERVLSVLGFMIIDETRANTVLDKEMLSNDLGAELLKKYQRRSEYQVLLIKPLQAVG